MYLAQAAVQANTGTRSPIPDSSAGLISDEARFEIYPQQRGERVKVPGFYAPFKDKGHLIPQFAPLYPTLLSWAHRIGGLSLSLRLDALLYLAGLSLLLLTAQKQGLSLIFLLAFVALQPATHWFARFHTAESLTFALFCLLLFAGTGLLCLPIIGKNTHKLSLLRDKPAGGEEDLLDTHRFSLSQDKPTGGGRIGHPQTFALAGQVRRRRGRSIGHPWGLGTGLLCFYVFCYSFAAFCLPWTTPAALPMAFLSMVPPLFLTQKRKARVPMMLAGPAGALSFSARYLSGSHPYGRQLLLMGPVPNWQILLLGLFLAVLVGFLTFLGCFLLKTDVFWPKLIKNRHFSLFILLITGGLSLISLILLPHTPAYVRGVLALAPLSMWFFAKMGLMHALGKGGAEAKWMLWLALSNMMLTIIYLLFPMIPEHYPWAWKRWFWFVVPSMALLCTAGVELLLHQHPNRKLLPISIALALLLTPSIWLHHALYRGGEWQGLSLWLEQISASLPENALVVTPKELATPLEFIYGHRVIPLYGGDDDRRNDLYAALFTNPPTGIMPVVLAHTCPAWLPGAQGQALPEYAGSWIKASRYPAGFSRQPRGFGLSIWSGLRLPATGRPCQQRPPNSSLIATPNSSNE